MSIDPFFAVCPELAEGRAKQRSASDTRFDKLGTNGTLETLA